MQPTTCLTAASIFITSIAAAQKPQLTFATSDKQVVIKVDDEAIGSYVYQDQQILRPYFAHIKAPGGVQVTRNHPPQQGDRKDHATMHPGIWLAFGDINGTDFWRNKARVKHVRFKQEPASERNMGSFIQEKRYVRTDGSTVCDEEFRFAIRSDKEAHFLLLESIFSGKREFYFGDQEEMGVGIRVATSISEQKGGQIVDAKQRKGAKKIWSNTAAWCDYSGEVDGQRAGITVMSHPTNFRNSWWHARDYGLLAANPFGRAAMQKGEPSKVIVKPGETLRLRFAVWVHADVDTESITKAYNVYAGLGR